MALNKHSLKFWRRLKNWAFNQIGFLTVCHIKVKLFCSDRELPPDDEHLINPADIPTVQPKFVKIVDQWASRSSANDSNLQLAGNGRSGRDSSGGLEKLRVSLVLLKFGLG